MNLLPLDFSAWTLGVIATLATCLLSFNWGMYRFFTVPSSSNTGIDTIKLVGTCFGLGSLIAIPLLGVASALTGSLALLLGAMSLSLFWWAIRTNRRRPLSFAFSDDLPEHLVCDGPYRCIRHPFYTAYLLGWLITPVATRELLMLVPFAVMTVIYIAAARVEERKFEATRLGEAYARYRGVAGMFWPRVRRSTQRHSTA
ncbi:isoprenylcysteine carboxylmethyltransferase family protein [Nevskia sp.]|uniref:methyltransferase family protein n=1 Tax=Nevskia sp. TaxID=1929292 RepID=UPI0025D5D336|nr:isoprenylcysteine carboxylmethyltransferase family protein [Nevskia sp.]